MIDEQRINNAKQILAKMKSNDLYNLAFEKDTLVFHKVRLPATIAYILIFVFLFFMGLFVKLYFLMILSLIGIGFVVYTEFLFNKYLVIDYNNDTLYLDKRRNGNSISKETICYFKDIEAVGVNNNLRPANRADKLEGIQKDDVEQSAVVFLKKDGTLLNFNEFIQSNKSYYNNCLLSDAISEIFSIPKLNCSKNKQLKVIKKGTKYQLIEAPLDKESHLMNLIKLFVIVASILGALFFILNNS